MSTLGNDAEVTVNWHFFCKLEKPDEFNPSIEGKFGMTRNLFALVPPLNALLKLFNECVILCG